MIISQLIQQLLHDGAYLKQLWETAIQWLQYEMEKSVLYSCSLAQVALIIHTLCGVLDYPCLSLQRPYVGSGYNYAG